MKKLLILLLTLLLCVPALAEPALPATPNPDGWAYVGYTPAGLTFLVPDDVVSYQLYESEKAAGVLFLGANDDCTIQLRRFDPADMTLDVFTAMMGFISGAQVEMRTVNGVEIIFYHNGSPSANSELCGIALNGTDGCMYKISFFTGVDGDFSESAAVWAIAETVADSVELVDYSEWPLAE